MRRAPNTPSFETVIASGDNGHSAASDVQDAITAASASAGTDSAAVRVVAIGVQGSIDPRTDKLSFIDTLPGWPRQGIRTHLETLLGLDVHIDNDANLAAIAERSEGAGAGTGSFALLWLGPASASPSISPAPCTAARQAAPGKSATCPCHGMPSTSTRRRTTCNNSSAARPQSPSPGATESPASRTRGDQRIGQPPAREAVFTEVARRIALGVVPVLAILDPELIVLGGPIGTSGGPLLAELVRVEIERTTLWHPRATQSLVPEYPVLRGAREVLVHQVRQHLFDELDK